MRLLISGGGRLSRMLKSALAPIHHVQTLSPENESDQSGMMFVGDPRSRELAEAAVSGCDVIVHILSPDLALEAPLDALDIATRGVYNLVESAAPSARLVLVGSLNFFERCLPEWDVNELWQPRPTPAAEDLAPYLAEHTAREVIRIREMVGMSLRLGMLVDDEDAKGQRCDPRWVHFEDAVQAIQKAINWRPNPDMPQTGFWVFHIVGGGKRTRFPLAAARKLLGYQPQHDLSSAIALPLTSTAPLPDKRFSAYSGSGAQNVVIFGAGGALAASVAADLRSDHRLRLADTRSIADALEATPERPGVPRPQALSAPHQEVIADITDSRQVLEAVQGTEAIINCTVVRYDPVESFRVNTLGAYNIACAAVACGVRRIVHTGNPTVAERYPSGYWGDFRLPADAPPRPGTSLYNLSKFLGYEVLRIFAEEYDLEVPVLCFNEFVNPSVPKPPQGIDQNPYYPIPFNSVAYCHTVSWSDATRALRLALHTPTFPHPFEIMHILTDLPHGKYSNEAAKRLLGWQPHDKLESYWLREFTE